MSGLSICMFSVLYIFIWAACKLLPHEIEIQIEWFSFMTGVGLFMYISITKTNNVCTIIRLLLVGSIK